jgi:glycosyltransferase involved in cell wall biosynthesis
MIPKVLIFIDWFIPGYKAGGPIRSCVNLIEHLKDNIEFYVITRNTDYCDAIPYKNIESDIWNTFHPNIHVYYLSKKNINFLNIKSLIKNTNFDFIYINGLYSFYFSILPMFFAKFRKHKNMVVAPRGMLSLQALSVKSFKKLTFIVLAKFTGLFKNITFHATNEDEAIDIRRALGENTKTKVAPNLPARIQTITWKERIKEKNAVKFISIARISPEKNTKYALERIIQCTKGKIEFDLYGSIYNQSYWEECKNIIQKAHSNVQINYKGSVDYKDVADLLTVYHFLLLPSVGENFGHSILEALAAGCPVIISDLTPWKGLEQKKIGWDIPLKQSQKFNDVLQYCASLDQENYNILSQNAFKYAKMQIENPIILEQTKNLFNIT